MCFYKETMFDFCAARSYNTSLVIRMNETNEVKKEETKEYSNEPVAGQISLFDLLAEMRC